MVIEDSAHTYRDDDRGGRGSHASSPGGYLIVRGRVVDVEELRLRPDWRGVHRAIAEFLSGDRASSSFVALTWSPTADVPPGGYLQRRG